jgi:hypothetical protein
LYEQHHFKKFAANNGMHFKKIGDLVFPRAISDIMKPGMIWHMQTGQIYPIVENIKFIVVKYQSHVKMTVQADLWPHCSALKHAERGQ